MNHIIYFLCAAYLNVSFEEQRKRRAATTRAHTTRAANILAISSSVTSSEEHFRESEDSLCHKQLSVVEFTRENMRMEKIKSLASMSSNVLISKVINGHFPRLFTSRETRQMNRQMLLQQRQQNRSESKISSPATPPKKKKTRPRRKPLHNPVEPTISSQLKQRTVVPAPKKLFKRKPKNNPTITSSENWMDQFTTLVEKLATRIPSEDQELEKDNNETQEHASESIADKCSRYEQEKQDLVATNVELIDKLKNQLETSYEKHLEMYSQTANQMGLKYQQTKAELVEMHAQAQEYKTTTTNLQGQLAQSMDQYKKLVDFCKHQKQINSKLQDQVLNHEELQQQYQQLEDQYKDLKQEHHLQLQNYEALEDNFKKMMQSSKLELEKRQQQYHELQVELHQSQQTITQQTNLLSEASSAKQQLDQALYIATQEINKLQDQTEYQHQILTKNEHQIQQLQQHLQQEQAHLLERNEKLLEQDNETNQKFRELDFELRQLRQQKTQLQLSYDTERQQHEKSENKIASLTNIIEELKTRICSLEAEASRAKTRENELKISVESKDQSLQTSRIEIVRLQEELRKEQQNVADVKEELISNSDRLASYRKDHLNLIQNLEAPLAVPYTATQWANEKDASHAISKRKSDPMAKYRELFAFE